MKDMYSTCTTVSERSLKYSQLQLRMQIILCARIALHITITFLQSWEPSMRKSYTGMCSYLLDKLCLSLYIPAWQRCLVFYLPPRGVVSVTTLFPYAAKLCAWCERCYGRCPIASQMWLYAFSRSGSLKPLKHNLDWSCKMRVSAFGIIFAVVALWCAKQTSKLPYAII